MDYTRTIGLALMLALLTYTYGFVGGVMAAQHYARIGAVGAGPR